MWRALLLLPMVIASCSQPTEELRDYLDPPDAATVADAAVADASIVADAGVPEARELCGLTPGEVLPVDIEYPQLLELVADNTSPAPGETAYYRGRVADDGEVVQLSITGPDSLLIHITEFDAEGRFEFEIPIDACIQEELAPSIIVLEDRAGRKTVLRDEMDGSFDIQHNGVSVGRMELPGLKISPTNFLPAPFITSYELQRTSEGFDAVMALTVVPCANARVALLLARRRDPPICGGFEDLRSRVITSANLDLRIPVAIPECQRGGEWRAQLSLRTPVFNTVRVEGQSSASLNLGPRPELNFPVLGPVEIETTTGPEGTVVQFTGGVEGTCKAAVQARIKPKSGDGFTILSESGLDGNRMSGCVAIPSSAPPGDYRFDSLGVFSAYSCSNGFYWEDDSYRNHDSVAISNSFVPAEEIVIRHP